MKHNAPEARSATRARVRPRVPGRPTQKAAAQLREICLAAGFDEFVERGFAAATIDGVARRAKASRSTVYRLFGDKEVLFRAVHQWALESRQSDLRTLLETDRPPKAMLALLIEQIYGDSVRPRDLALTRLFIAESRRFPELADILFEHALFEPLIEYLRSLAERGIVAIDDPVEAAWDFTALAVGGVRMLLKEPIVEPRALRARTARLTNLITRGWLREDATETP